MFYGKVVSEFEGFGGDNLFEDVLWFVSIQRFRDFVKSLGSLGL